MLLKHHEKDQISRVVRQGWTAAATGSFLIASAELIRLLDFSHRFGR
jgi:hypothetical protein